MAEGLAAAFSDRIRHLGQVRGDGPAAPRAPRLDYVDLVDAEYRRRRASRRRIG